MRNKVVVITGATSGIGQAAAEHLAGMGARIVLVARDRKRGETTLETLRKNSPGIGHSAYYADLSRLREMKKVASEIAAAEPRIDVLINNAGALFSSRELTEDGLERTFALNHMAYFVLTCGLREKLIASAPARIVNTTSGAHQMATLDLDDLQSVNAYRTNIYDWFRHGGGGHRVYRFSKLCNILFTRELARQLKGTGVTANSFHPGFVATRFADQAGGLISLKIRLAKLNALSPQQGMKTLVYLASSPEVERVTGEYFCNCRSVLPSAQAQDEAAAKRLWDETAKLAGLEG